MEHGAIKGKVCARFRPVSPLHLALRTATGDIHGRIDALLSGGFSTRADYACYLQGMHAFLGAAVDAQPARTLWRDLQRLAEADLAVLDVPPLPAVRAAAVEDDAASAGWEYVVGGAALGARVLLRDARALGIEEATGASFLTCHAAMGAQWPMLVARLDAHPGAGDPAFVDAACQAARAAFIHAEAAMRAACPEPV